MILKLQDGGRGGAGLEALVDEVAEIAAWCACTGIPMVSIYEKTGRFYPFQTPEPILTSFRHTEGLHTCNP